MAIRADLHMLSSSGRDTIHITEWRPDGEPMGIIQISHGMIECIDRYSRFADYMTKRGFLVIGNDHLGHGDTAAKKNYGYFTPEDGSRYVVRDLYRVSCYVRSKYPGIPLILLGHSMGSFMARRYAMTYGGELDGLILMGTGGKPEWLLRFGILLSKALIAVKGDRAPSWLMEKLCFALYNEHFRPARTPSDWLTRDKKQVDAYLAREDCRFVFTLNGYRTLLEVLSYIQKKKNIRKIPRSLPILLLSGSEDPVGDYGRGVREVAWAYHQAGVRDLTCHLYPDARHELLNELNYREVQHDLRRWITKHVTHQPS